MIGTASVAISFVCFFISIYFGMLLLGLTVDEQLKAQYLALATSFFVAGMVIIVLSAVVKIIGRLFSEKVPKKVKVEFYAKRKKK